MNKEEKMAAAAHRRQYFRVTPEPGAPVRVDINGDGFIEVIKAVDISEGGIRITVPHRFEGCHVDQPVSLIITLPQPVNKQFCLEGKIKHVRNDSFGVLFTKLDDKSLAFIRSYVGQWYKKRTVWETLQDLLGIKR